MKKDSISKKWVISHKIISEECGVSRRVVSAVLTPSEKSRQIGFSEETRLKVEETAKRLCYRPNRTVTNFNEKRHRSYTILTSHADTMTRKGLQSLINKARKDNIILNVELVTYDETIPISVQENTSDGIIIMNAISSHIIKEIIRLKIPAVQVNEPNSLIPHINFDDDDLMMQLLTIFKNANKKNVLLINCDEGKYDEPRNKAIFHNAKLLNFPEPKILNLDKSHLIKSNRDKNFNLLYNFLKDNDNINAIIMIKSVIVGLVYDVINKLNKNIPNDIAVIALSDSLFLDMMNPPTTTLERSDGYAAEIAIDMLKDILENKNVENKMVNYTLVDRESV